MKIVIYPYTDIRVKKRFKNAALNGVKGKHYWAFKHTKNHKKYWKSLNKNDIIVFYTNKQLTHYAKVIRIFKDRILGKKYFIDGPIDGFVVYHRLVEITKPEEISISLAEYNKLSNYDEKSWLRKAILIKKDYNVKNLWNKISNSNIEFQHNWESVIKMHMQKINKPIHYKDLLKIIKPDLAKHGIGLNNKNKSEKVRQKLQERTFLEYGKEIWYESTLGRGKGIYSWKDAKTKFIPTSLRIKTKKIERKLLDENKQYQDYVNNPKKLQEATKKHEKIIQVIMDYAKEYNIELKEIPNNADILIENNKNETTLVEVKTTNHKNIKRQLRSGMAQLLEYKFFYLLAKGNKNKKINTYLVYSDAELDINTEEFLNNYIDGVLQYKDKKNIVKKLFNI